MVTQKVCNELGYGINWSVVSGRIYQVETETLLTHDQSWQLLTNFTAGESTNYFLLINADDPLRMYRLNVKRP